MNEKEAIETLQDIRDVAECRIKRGDQRGVVYIPPDKLQDFNIAISALEEIQQYRAFGTVEELRKAREKQKAKKPVKILRHRGGFEMEHCPNCDTDYQVDRRYTIYDDYCPTCGKLLDSSFRNFCGNCGQAIVR